MCGGRGACACACGGGGGGGGGGGVSCFYSFGEPLTDGLTQCLCIDRTLLYS